MKFNKESVKVLLASVILFNFLNSSFAQQNTDNDFAYRPYPVILVHGFGSAPGESWGTVTEKSIDQDEIISTRILDTATMNSDVSFGRDLIQSYDNFPGYWDTLSLKNHRLIPFEEEGSYEGINHTYVETYCSYYRYESNDGKGCRHPEFSISDAPAGQYDISEGGQTQLLRIRIIQTLNEYYGDFKWVNDPSAKVRLVGHSNGVVAITNVLKNEENEGWFNEGKNKQKDGYSWDELDYSGDKWKTPDGDNYIIDGFGFRLRDHIDVVYAWNGPFAGTPLADKNGEPSELFTEIVFFTTRGAKGIVSVILVPAATLCFAQAISSTSPTGKVLWSLCGGVLLIPTTLLHGVSIFPDKLLGYIEGLAFGGCDNPLFIDDAVDSDFIKRLKGNGLPPLYSNGTLIPYYNYTSDLNGTGKKINLFATTGFITGAAIAATIGVVRGSVVAFIISADLASGAVGSAKLAKWCKESDFIIPDDSQDMTNTYNYPSSLKGNRPVVKFWHDIMHTDLTNTKFDEMKCDFDDNTEINFTHAVPFKYSGKLSCNPKEDTLIVKQVDGNGKELNRYEVIQFQGMNPIESDPKIKWSEYIPEGNKIGVGRESKGARYIVANLKNYFMNNSTVSCKVNFGPWDLLKYGEDYGYLAASRVDDNLDGIIDTNDYYEGSYIFAPTVDTFGGPEFSSIHIGMNSVYLKVGDYSGTTMRGVTVIYGTDICLPYEADSTGEKLTDFDKKILFYITQWKEHENKDLYVSFVVRAKTDEGGVAFEGNDSDFVLLKANDCHAVNKVNPQVGEWEYYFKHNNSSYSKLDDVDPATDTLITDCNKSGNPTIPRHLNYMRIRASFNHLRKMETDTSEPALIQQLRLKVKSDSYTDVTTGKEISGETENILNLPFLVDNEPPKIRQVEPVLVNDYNRDGYFDPETDTITVVTIPEGTGIDTLPGFDSSALSIPDSNGVDDDGDLIADDIGEFMNIAFYSPEWENDSLVSMPFQFFFEINDNSAIILPTGKFLRWTLYKVNGNVHDSLSDEVLHTDTLKYLPKFKSHYLFEWDYEEIKNRTDKDGLYCAVSECIDRAGNRKVNVPAYFIIDTKKPDVDVYSAWRDYNGLENIANINSNGFGFRYAPKRPTDRYDSETDKLIIILHALNEKGEKLGRDPYTFTSEPGYKDVYTNTENGMIAFDSITEEIRDIPDGNIDVTEFILEVPSTLNSPLINFRKYNILDGKYHVEVIAVDKAGNEKHIEDLENYNGEKRVITIDRERPVFSENTVFPTLFHDSTSKFTLVGRISEKDDCPYNRTENVFDRDSVFKLRIYFLDSLIKELEIKPSVSVNDSDFYTEIQDSLGVLAYGIVYGRNSITVEIEDPHYNTATSILHFFYKSLGNEILNEFNEDGVSGKITINGILSDPDESNNMDFDRYEIHVKDETGGYHPEAVFMPGDTAQTSSGIIRINDVLGYVNTSILPDGIYTLELWIFEKGNPVPKIISKEFLVNHSIQADTLDPEINAVFPKDSFDPGDSVFTWTYTLQNRVCDVRTKIVNKTTNQVAFHQKHSNVVPFEEGEPDTSMNGENYSKILFWRNAGDWYLKWKFPYIINIEPFTGTVSDINCSDTTLTFYVDANVLTITSPYTFSSNNDYNISFDKTLVSNCPETRVSVSAGASYKINPCLIMTGVNGLNPAVNPFYIRNTRTFTWNGKSPLGKELDNGEYIVCLNATASNGMGYDEIPNKTITFNAGAHLSLTIDTIYAIRLNKKGAVEIPASILFKVNKICDAELNVYQRGEKEDKIIRQDKMHNVVSGTQQSLVFMWDGKVNESEYVSPNEEYYGVIIGQRYSEKDTVTFDIGVEKFDFVNGEDPFILSGNKKGMYRDSFQVVSGDARANVHAHYKGKYFNPVPFSFKVSVYRQNPISLQCEYTCITRLDYRKYVHAFTQWKIAKSQSCRTDTGVVITSFDIDNYNGWRFSSFLEPGINVCPEINSCQWARPCFDSCIMEFPDSPMKYVYLDTTMSPQIPTDNLIVSYFDRFKYGKDNYVPLYYVSMNRDIKHPQSGFWKYGFYNSGNSYELKADYSVNNVFKYMSMITFSKDIINDNEKRVMVDSLFNDSTGIKLSWDTICVISFKFDTLTEDNFAEYPDVIKMENGISYPSGWKNTFIEDLLSETGLEFNDSVNYRANYSIEDLDKILRLRPMVFQQSGEKDTFYLAAQDINHTPDDLRGNIYFGTDSTLLWNLGEYCDWYEPEDSLFLKASWDASICTTSFTLLSPPGDSCPGCIFEEVIGAGDIVLTFTLDRNNEYYGKDSISFTALMLGVDSLHDIKDIEITPVIYNGTSWEETDFISYTHDIDGNFLNVAFTITDTLADDSIETWDPPFTQNTNDTCDSKLDVNGDLTFFVETPDEIADWEDVQFIEKYEDNTISQNGVQPLFVDSSGGGGGVMMNPNLYIDSVNARITYIDSSLYEALEDSVRYYPEYGGCELKLSFNPNEENKNIVQFNIKPSFQNPDSSLKYYAIEWYQNGRGGTVVKDIDKNTEQIKKPHFWNAGFRGGEFWFHLNFYEKDSSGNRINKIIYGQNSYIGYIISDSAYNNDRNYVAKSPFIRTEIIYNYLSSDSTDTINVFDTSKVSSVNPVRLGEAALTGVVPDVGDVDLYSPGISITPSNVQFENEKEPTLKFRYLRDEVVKIEGTDTILVINSKNLAMIYHIDNRTGELTDITSGTIDAIEYGGTVKFDSDTNTFDYLLKSNDYWDYVQITAVPTEFSHCIPLREANTILDRVELDPGKVTKPEYLKVMGRFIPYQDSTPRAALHPVANAVRVVMNFEQDKYRRSIDSAEGHIDNIDTLLELSAYSDEIEFSIDSINLPGYIGNGDTVFVYAEVLNTDSLDTLRGINVVNSGVSYAEYIIKTISTGFKITPLNPYISTVHKLAQYIIEPNEQGKLKYVQNNRTGLVETVKFIDVINTAYFTISFTDTTLTGNVREEGIYPFNLSFYDTVGNMFGEEQVGAFYVDYTPPVLDHGQFEADDSTKMSFKFTAGLRDNFKLHRTDILFVSDSSNIFYTKTIHHDSTFTDNISIPIPVSNLCNYKNVRALIYSYDEAGNNSVDTVKFNLLDDEDLDNDWQDSTIIVIVIPDEIDLTENLIDYPFLVTLTDGNFDFSEALPDGRDLRFTSMEGNPLFFEIEKWNTSEEIASIWLRVPLITPQEGIYKAVMYWGNDSAADISWLSPAAWNNTYKSVYHMHTSYTEFIEDSVQGSGFVIPGFGLFATGDITMNPKSKVINGSAGSNGKTTLGGVEAGNSAYIGNDVISGGRIILDYHARVDGDATSGDTVIMKTAATVGGTVTQYASVPDKIIPVKSVPISSSNIYVGLDDVKTLYPGTYGTITIDHRAVLEMKPGVYNCYEFKVPGHDSRIIYNIDSTEIIEINVENKLEFDGYRILTEFDGTASAKNVSWYTNQSTDVYMGPALKFAGTVTAPNAKIDVEQADTLRGALYAKNIFMNWDAILFTETGIVHPVREVIPDATTNRNNGTNNNALFTRGLISKGLAFDGDSSYIIVEPSQSLRTPDAFTFSTWVKRDRTGNFETLSGKHDILSTGWRVVVDSLNYPVFYVDNQALTSDSIIVDKDEWCHIAGVISTDTIQLYVNGKLAGEKSYSGWSGTHDSVALFIGKWLGDRKFSGTLDEMRISDVALPETWIKLDNLTQTDTVNIVQIPVKRPESIQAYCDCNGNVVLKVQMVDSVTDVGFKKRVSNGTWSLVDPVRISTDTWVDTRVKCETSYEYKARYLFGLTVSEWSDSAVVMTADCYTESDFLEIKCMTLDNGNEPINDDSANVKVRLYVTPVKGISIYEESFNTKIINGLCTVYLTDITRLKNILKRDSVLYAEMEVYDIVQEPRIPLTAEGISTITNPQHLKGEGSPVGIIKADAGSVYLDTQDNSVYFKHGESIDDWKKVE